MSSRKKRRTYKLEREYHPPVVTMVRYSNPGVLRDLPTDKLTSGLAYQRPVELKAVEELIRDWDPRLLEPINVSFRGGEYNVLDGQHRITCMKKMADGKDVIVPCRVYGHDL